MDTAILKGQGHVIFPHHLNIKELLISKSLVDIYKHTCHLALHVIWFESNVFQIQE
jgi:hypothetical protein